MIINSCRCSVNNEIFILVRNNFFGFLMRLVIFSDLVNFAGDSTLMF